MIQEKKNSSVCLKLLVCFFITSFSFAQYTIPEIPKLQTSVYDYANLLSASEKTQLEEKLIMYSDSTSTQIVIVTIMDLKGENIDALSTNWAQKWGIGQAKEDNGVFILIAKNDRLVSIRPGLGLEDKLIAATCGQIIDYQIVPEFKTGNYYKGLDKGADAIIDVVKGKYKGERKNNKKNGKFPILPIIIIFIIIMIIIAKNKNNGGNSGNNSGGPSLMDVIILSSLGRGGGFGGSSGGGFGGGSGGGFGGGFGGGGFSGGGASGGW